MTKKLRVPSICKRRDGRPYMMVRDADGNRRHLYLRGGWERDDWSAETYRHAREVIAGLMNNGAVVRVKPPTGQWPTVGQLCAAFLLHAQRYYVDEMGESTGEALQCSYAFGKLLELHRDTSTDRMTIRDLLDVRQAMVDARDRHQKGRQAPRGLSRRTVNDRVHRIKRLFRWGVEQKLVPGSVWHELSALRGVPKGRGGAHDNPPVVAVPRAMVDAVLPHLPAPLAAAIELQWWSGMRPAEVLQLRVRDLDRSGKVWTFTPEQHKNSWRDRPRVVKLGPKAQAILRPLLRADGGYLISPRDAVAGQKAEKRANRQTPPTKQMRERDARAAQAEPQVGDRYDTDTYRRAITRACKLAKVEPWSPHRLRHSAGTRICLQAGLEEARAALGHADDSVTRRYAVAADSQLAADVMGRLG